MSDFFQFDLLRCCLRIRSFSQVGVFLYFVLVLGWNHLPPFLFCSALFLSNNEISYPLRDDLKGKAEKIKQ